MKVCIYGAGAIGGYLGAELFLAGIDVTIIARGESLRAIRENGLKLLIGGEERIAHPACTDDPAEAGPHDYVFLAVKANAVPVIVEGLSPLLGPETAVVTAVNGIPYWYFYKLSGSWEDHRLESIDPGGRQWELIGPERAIGCVLYPATERTAPGVIQHVSGDRFSLGEPDGTKSERVTRLSRAMIEAGFKAPVRPRIREEIWVKLWGNLAFNPISALTGSTLEDIVRDPGTREAARSMMVEAQEIAERLRVKFPIDIDARIQGAEAVGAHKTSMLQDLEAGREMELDALVGVVAELGRLVGVATPIIDSVYALTRRRAVEAGCFKS
jgi:2-dehydropantoate 2-reductase